MIVTPVSPSAGRMPLGIPAVELSSSTLLGTMQQRNVDLTLPHVLEQLEVSGVMDNFRRLGSGQHLGFVFADSDLYKTLEAIGWEIARTGTDQFDPFLEQALGLMRACQQPDGYLNTWGMSDKSPGQWKDLAWGHELYCAGHAIQAAVALRRAGRPECFEIASALADLIVERFAKEGTCGHPVIETALVELFRETGHARYLETAAAFLERRGNPTTHTEPFGSEYFQDHCPPAAATRVTGHVVRQLYLDAGCVDVAVETGDTDLLDAVVARWEHAHRHCMFITGGMGSHFQDESFGDDFELASERAYAETCAAIADFQLSWRLFLATGDARYPAAMERLVYNAIPAAVSEAGTEFTYANPLQVRPHARAVEYNSGRLPCFSCACCPPNLARLIASLRSAVASVDGNTLELTVPTAARSVLPEAVGQGELRTEGDLEQGHLRVTVQGTLHPGASIKVRIPQWARRPAQVPLADGGDPDWLVLPPGDEHRIDFDVRPRFVVADPRVDAVRGSVAIQCGPTIMCCEPPDDVDVDRLAVQTEYAPSGGPEGCVVQAHVLEELPPTLYAPAGQGALPVRTTSVPLIPYREWGNAGRRPMRVWLPIADPAAPLAGETLPMGWNSWDCFGGSVTESEVLENAEFLAEHLRDAGWDTVVVDIQWYESSPGTHGYSPELSTCIDAFGRPVPSPERFPSSAGGRGFAPLAARIHSMGLRFGVHLMRGVPRRAVESAKPVWGTDATCADIADEAAVCPWNPDNVGVRADHPASAAWYRSVIRQLADWGVDFIKLDDVLYPPIQRADIAMLAEAIEEVGRPMQLSLSPGKQLSLAHLGFLRGHATMWRISDDVWDTWEAIEEQFQRAARWAPHQRQGAWADLDMLPLGRLGIRAHVGEERDSRLTLAEQRTVMSLWAMARSPLMIGGHLPKTSPETIALINQPEVLDVARRSSDNRELIRDGDLVVWAARLDGAEIRAVFWLGSKPRTVRIHPDDLGVHGTPERESWGKTIAASDDGTLAIDLEPHDVALLRWAGHKEHE